MDKGHKEADQELKRLESKLRKTYKRAYVEMKKKADAYFSTFEKEDAQKKKLVQEGKMTESAYQEWRMDKMLRGYGYENMMKELSTELTKTNMIASGLIENTVVSAYESNYNYAGYEICNSCNMNIAFDLVDHATVNRLIKKNPQLLPMPQKGTKAYESWMDKDTRWNYRKIRSAFTQSLMQGESIPKMAKRLQSVTDMSNSAATRNARTMTTSAESAGRMDRYHEAQKMGIELEKTWLATLDARTRDAHIELDGVTIDVDEEFENSLGKIMCPGDPKAVGANVYNCRCTLISNVKGFRRDLSDRVMGKGLEGMTYEEWKSEAQTRIEERKKNMLNDPIPEENQDVPSKHVTETDAKHPKSWTERADDAKDWSWAEMHETMVNDPDSYIHTDEYKEANAEYQRLWKTEKNADDEISELKKELKNEQTVKPKSEWTIDDEISAILGEKPMSYTSRGKEINERISVLEKRSADARIKSREYQAQLDLMDSRARESELREWNKTSHPFVKGSIDKDYAGFSTTMRIAQYDEDLKNGKGFIAEMSPDEYLDRISYDIFVLSKERTTSCFYDNVKKYAEEMANGEKFDMGYINYESGIGGEKGQEGRHRAMAAKILGIEKIPVYIKI